MTVIFVFASGLPSICLRVVRHTQLEPNHHSLQALDLCYFVLFLDLLQRLLGRNAQLLAYLKTLLPLLDLRQTHKRRSKPHFLRFFDPDIVCTRI
jgi:hypothetical protein